ncbi:MAG TPA: four helix bundle protein [Saprospiraceae bacterium]|nr:four helix bundle protein [Saprospiraceae bacterium]HNT20458.1 four helix bundle protein [Saprospiraceae bacterium]
MKIEKFEDLAVWNEALELAKEIYLELKASRDYSFRDQLQRSAVSISSNIAEGFERQTNKEFIQFLYIAKGSCGELRTQVHLAMRIGILNQEKSVAMLEKTKKISSMLYGLIKVRKEKFK